MISKRKIKTTKMPRGHNSIKQCYVIIFARKAARNRETGENGKKKRGKRIPLPPRVQRCPCGPRSQTASCRSSVVIPGPLVGDLYDVQSGTIFFASSAVGRLCVLWATSTPSVNLCARSSSSASATGSWGEPGRAAGEVREVHLPDRAAVPAAPGTESHTTGLSGFSPSPCTVLSGHLFSKSLMAMLRRTLFFGPTPAGGGRTGPASAAGPC